MEEEIKNLCHAFKYKYIPINNETSLKIIHDAFFNHKIEKMEYDDPKVHLYYGMYFEIRKQIPLSIEQYTKAVNMGNIDAAYYLSRVYRNIGNENKMLEYLLVAANHNHIDAIFDLAKYYQNKKDIPTMEKYYNIGIASNDIRCINGLGEYYFDHDIKLDVMVQIFEIGVNLKSVVSINHLANYYKLIKYYNKMIYYLTLAGNLNYLNAYIELAKYYESIGDCPNMIKTYLNAIDLNSIDAMTNLGLYYRGIDDFVNMEKYLLMAVKQGDIDSLHYLIETSEKQQNTEKYIEYLTIGCKYRDDECIEKMVMLEKLI